MRASRATAFALRARVHRDRGQSGLQRRNAFVDGAVVVDILALAEQGASRVGAIGLAPPLHVRLAFAVGIRLTVHLAFEPGLRRARALTAALTFGSTGCASGLAGAARVAFRGERRATRGCAVSLVCIRSTLSVALCRCVRLAARGAIELGGLDGALCLAAGLTAPGAAHGGNLRTLTPTGNLQLGGACRLHLQRRTLDIATVDFDFAGGMRVHVDVAASTDTSVGRRRGEQGERQCSSE